MKKMLAFLTIMLIPTLATASAAEYTNNTTQPKQEKTYLNHQTTIRVPKHYSPDIDSIARTIIREQEKQARKNQ